MSEENKIQIFEDKKIRTAWNESEEEWYFSIVDVISVLTVTNLVVTGAILSESLKLKEQTSCTKISYN